MANKKLVVKEKNRFIEGDAEDVKDYCDKQNKFDFKMKIIAAVVTIASLFIIYYKK